MYGSEIVGKTLEEIDKAKDLAFKEKKIASESVLEIIKALNSAGNTQDITPAFKERLNSTIGTELIAAIFYKIKDIALKESPHDHKITQEQAANYFHKIRGLFSIVYNNN